MDSDYLVFYLSRVNLQDIDWGEVHRQKEETQIKNKFPCLN